MPEDVEKKIAGEVSETRSTDAYIRGKLTEIQSDYIGTTGDVINIDTQDVFKPGSFVASGAMSIDEGSTSDSGVVTPVTFAESNIIILDHKTSKVGLVLVNERKEKKAA